MDEEVCGVCGGVEEEWDWDEDEEWDWKWEEWRRRMLALKAGVEEVDEEVGAVECECGLCEVCGGVEEEWDWEWAGMELGLEEWRRRRSGGVEEVGKVEWLRWPSTK